MKKRLLITSIVMMLVVAVALSTATYAWFTSNATVSASQVTLTADSASGTALGIGWYGGTTGTSIQTAAPSGSLAPMIPAAINTTQNSETALSAFSFAGSTIYTSGGISMFNAENQTNNVYARTPYTLTQSSASETVFYLENLSGTKDITSITLTATIAGDAKDLVRIAIFTCGTTYSATAADYSLVDVLVDSAATTATGTCYGNVAANGPILGQTGTALSSYTAKTTKDLGGLTRSTSKYFKIVMWLDGDALTDAFAGDAATIDLSFTAA